MITYDLYYILHLENEDVSTYSVYNIFYSRWSLKHGKVWRLRPETSCILIYILYVSFVFCMLFCLFVTSSSLPNTLCLYPLLSSINKPAVLLEITFMVVFHARHFRAWRAHRYSVSIRFLLFLSINIYVFAFHCIWQWNMYFSIDSTSYWRAI